MGEDIVALAAVLGGLGTAVLIVGIIMWVHYRKQVMRNQERLAAIEKGVALPAEPGEDRPHPSASHWGHPLYRATRLLFIGAGLALALYVTAGPKAAVWGGFVAFIGLGHLVYWLFVGRNVGTGTGTDGCC